MKDKLRIKGRLIPENDIWIAAITLQYDLVSMRTENSCRGFPLKPIYRFGLPERGGLAKQQSLPYNLLECMGQRRSAMARMVKKTIELNQDYIDRIREILGAKTDKEAVNKALELALIDDEIVNAHKLMANKGNIVEDIFE